MSLGNHIVDGKKVDPKHATPKNRGRANRTKKIFVGGVSQDTSADEVKAYFSQFGKVGHVSLYATVRRALQNCYI